MSAMKAALCTLIPVSLGGCLTTNTVKFPKDAVTVADLLQEVKHEVGEYARSEKHDTRFSGVCGKDQAITIKSVKITMTTATTGGGSVDASAEIPIGGATIGPRVRTH